MPQKCWVQYGAGKTHWTEPSSFGIMRAMTACRQPYLTLPLLALLLGGCVIHPTKETGVASQEPAAAPPSISVASKAVANKAPPAASPIEECEAPHDLWHRIRNGFQLQAHDHPRIAPDLAWFERHPRYMERVAERATPYLHLIVEELAAREMPMELALLPVVESAYQPFAYSHGRAAGIWQFIPGTGRRFGLEQTWWYDGRRDIGESTRAALDYLQYLHGFFDGDWLHALAAYNAGEGTVRRAIRRNQADGKATDYWSLPLPRETQSYVPRLLALSRLVDSPASFGQLIPSIADEPYLVRVEVGSQIDLDLAAELAGLSIEQIYLYNPGFNRWATDPNGPHHLMVPLEVADQFQQNLATYPPNERIHWVRYQVKGGDALGPIAQRHKTTVELIRQVNNMRGNTIRAGQMLIIPVARTDLERYRLSASQRLEAQQNRQRHGERIEYRVREGDTLWAIARRHGVSTQQLAQWNGMAPRDTLRPGRTLVIWSQQADDRLSTLNPADFVHPFEQATTRRIGYTVRQGDSLAAISQRFRVDVDSLRRWNNLEGQRYIQPGQRLTLYVDVRTQSGS